jgi:hypothetical protein
MRLRLGSNHTQSNRFALTLRGFQACFLRLFPCLERFRYRGELQSDVFVQQPPLSYFWHIKCIARAWSVFYAAVVRPESNPVREIMSSIVLVQAVAKGPEVGQLAVRPTGFPAQPPIHRHSVALRKRPALF